MSSIDWNDPLSILLAQEEGDEQECDVLHSCWEAGCHRAPCYERERGDDMLGASPFELENHITLN